MKVSEIEHGKAYDCTLSGEFAGKKISKKACVVLLAKDSDSKDGFIIIEADNLQKENPGLYGQLIAMSFGEIRY